LKKSNSNASLTEKNADKKYRMKIYTKFVTSHLTLLPTIVTTCP